MSVHAKSAQSAGLFAPLFWSAFLVFAFVFHFKHLGATSLWQDEAETAVLARNVIRFGVPEVWDGKNLISQNMGQDHNLHGLWNYSPWLGIYVAAGSFAFFGQSAFTARLPFALFSLAALWLLFVMSGRWSADKRTPYLAVWLMLLSVPYLLHARQCRYYVLDAFFALYLYYAYQQCIESKKNAALHLSLSALGLFHSNFLVFFAVLGGIAAHFWLCVLHKSKVLHRNAAAIGVAVLLLAPGCLFFHVFSRAGGENAHWFAARAANLRNCLRDADYYVFPALLALLLPLGRKRLEKLEMPLCYLGGGLLTLILAPHYFFRYLIPFIPVASFLMADILWMLYDRIKLAAAGILVLLLATHGLSASYWSGYGRPIKAELADFTHEIFHPIKEPIKAAADYLNEHAQPDDLLLVSYPDLPFMFYTPLRVIGGRSGLHAISTEDVSWILVRNDSEKSGWPLDYSNNYEKIELDAPNYPWGNRPDPDFHVYRTVNTPEHAVIYHRL